MGFGLNEFGYWLIWFGMVNEQKLVLKWIKMWILKWIGFKWITAFWKMGNNGLDCKMDLKIWKWLRNGF